MRRKRHSNILVWAGAVCLLIIAIALGTMYVIISYQTNNLQQEITTLQKENSVLKKQSDEIQNDLDDPDESFEGNADEVVENESQEQSDATIKGLVAIDPGHQGSWVDMSEPEPDGPGSSTMKAKATTGTQGRYTGINEYELNLDISLMLAEELEARGYEVVLTRKDNDTAISNSERAILANESGADFLIRIHANGSDDLSMNGALAMVPGADNPYVGYLAEKSTELAQNVLNSYCEATMLDNRGLINENTMTGINWSEIPVMILEMGFMTNESDDTKMADSAFRIQMVNGIANGIDTYFSKNPTKAIVESDKTSIPEESAELQELLSSVRNQYLQGAEAIGERWAVSVQDLTHNQGSNVNGDVKMKSASVIKIFIMATVYDRVCYPKSPDEEIYFQENYEGELKELLTKMITISDNDAANLIVERLGNGDFSKGMSVVNEFCQENGYSNTSMGRKFLDSNAANDNFTSANDCVNLMAAIYKGFCVNTEASAKMMEYLKNQTKISKIPSGIEDYNVITANKTGELSSEGLGYVENDVAVIWGENLDYVICVLSGDLKEGNQTAIDRISGISKMIYERLGA